MLNPGDKAPDFIGREHNGNTVKLSDFRIKEWHARVDARAWPAEVVGTR
jgi:hypothetical protein